MSELDWKNARGKTLTLPERTWLKKAAEAVSKSFEHPLIVNIGVFKYASMYCLRAGAPAARIVGIDIKKPGIKQHPQLKASIVIADSSKYWREFNEEVQLLFIDGDHRYRGVKADIHGWARKVSKGGVIAFHDYAPTPYHLQKLPILEGVRRAVSEFAAEAGWPVLGRADSLIGFRRPIK